MALTTLIPEMGVNIKKLKATVDRRTSNRVIDNTQIFSRVLNFSFLDNERARHLLYSVVECNGLLPRRAINELVPSATNEN